MDLINLLRSLKLIPFRRFSFLHYAALSMAVLFFAIAVQLDLPSTDSIISSAKCAASKTALGSWIFPLSVCGECSDRLPRVILMESLKTLKETRAGCWGNMNYPHAGEKIVWRNRKWILEHHLQLARIEQARAEVRLNRALSGLWNEGGLAGREAILRADDKIWSEKKRLAKAAVDAECGLWSYFMSSLCTEKYDSYQVILSRHAEILTEMEELQRNKWTLSSYKQILPLRKLRTHTQEFLQAAKMFAIQQPSVEGSKQDATSKGVVMAAGSGSVALQHPPGFMDNPLELLMQTPYGRSAAVHALGAIASELILLRQVASPLDRHNRTEREHAFARLESKIATIPETELTRNQREVLVGSGHMLFAMADEELLSGELEEVDRQVVQAEDVRLQTEALKFRRMIMDKLREKDKPTDYDGHRYKAAAEWGQMLADRGLPVPGELSLAARQCLVSDSHLGSCERLDNDRVYEIIDDTLHCHTRFVENLLSWLNRNSLCALMASTLACFLLAFAEYLDGCMRFVQPTDVDAIVKVCKEPPTSHGEEPANRPVASSKDIPSGNHKTMAGIKDKLDASTIVDGKHSHPVVASGVKQ